MRPVLTLAEKARCIWLYLIYRANHPVVPSMRDLVRLTKIPFEEVYPPIYLVNMFCQAKNLPLLSALLDFNVTDISIPTHCWFWFNENIREIKWMGLPPVETREFESLIPNQPRKIDYQYEKPNKALSSPHQRMLTRSESDLASQTLSIWQCLVFYAGYDVGPMTESRLEEMSGTSREDFKQSLYLIGRYCFDQHLLPLDSIVIEDFEDLRVIEGMESRMISNLRKFPWFSIRHPDRIGFVPYFKELESNM